MYHHSKNKNFIFTIYDLVLQINFHSKIRSLTKMYREELIYIYAFAL